MTAALKFDPPRSPDAPPPEPRRLTREELRLVQSGSPYVRSKRPGLNAEPTHTLHPWAFRGLYPEPGLSYRMRIRDAAIDSGLTQKFFRALARPWRILDLPNASDDAKARAASIRQQLYGLRRGLARAAADYLDRGDQYGFGAAERVWQVTDDGLWKLAGLVWLESWQVYGYIDDDNGFPLFVVPRDANGLGAPIPFDKLAWIGRRDTSRCPEGHNANRPLYWASEDKRRILVRNADARDQIGLGTRVYSIDAYADSAKERDMIASIEEQRVRNVERGYRYVAKPKEIELDWDYGPPTAPQYRDDLQYHDHTIARQYGDTLSEEGQSMQGARAVGVEKRKTADLVEQGEAKGMAASMTEELIWPICEANGWPIEEAPYCHVAGFADVGAWRAIAEIIRADTERRTKAPAQGQTLTPILEDQDIDDMRNAFRLGFGLGADYV